METTDPNVIQKGHLGVGDGHSIYWEDWGNRKATPIFSLHGGPGAGFNDKHKFLFDPKIHRVIFHDQRGSGKSTPFAETKHNTTQDLIGDIEKLRKHLHIDNMYVAGGSWGSALALLYSLAHPKRVLRMLIWGVFLARQFEIDFVNEGYPRYFFPEEWNRFISLVPKEHRKNGTSVMKYYVEKIHSKDKSIATTYADEWTLWESTLLSMNYNRLGVEMETIGDKDNVAVAKLETHYFLKRCFIPENYIINNISKIKHIPCSVVQGRFDMCTPPISAYDLAKAYGKNATLQWVNTGHVRSEPEMFAALKATIRALFVRRDHRSS